MKTLYIFLQTITYKEYLPNVLGPVQMTKFNLDLEVNRGQPHVYRETVNPSAANVFATAAFRFGHAEITFGTAPKER